MLLSALWPMQISPYCRYLWIHLSNIFRNYSFSAYAKFSEKLTTYQGLRIVNFSENLRTLQMNIPLLTIARPYIENLPNLSIKQLLMQLYFLCCSRWNASYVQLVFNLFNQSLQFTQVNLTQLSEFFPSDTDQIIA